MTARYLASTRAVIRKRFAAPRERVFQMWTEAEHLRRWFFPGPAEQATPHVQVDPACASPFRRPGTVGILFIIAILP
jgi:uncharacterized protein YndB with AHSA1/START domain